MLNASVVTKDYLEGAKKANVDFNKIALTHNFYPLTGT